MNEIGDINTKKNKNACLNASRNNNNKSNTAANAGDEESVNKECDGNNVESVTGGSSNTAANAGDEQSGNKDNHKVTKHNNEVSKHKNLVNQIFYNKPTLKEKKMHKESTCWLSAEMEKILDQNHISLELILNGEEEGMNSTYINYDILKKLFARIVADKITGFTYPLNRTDIIDKINKTAELQLLPLVLILKLSKLFGKMQSSYDMFYKKSIYGKGDEVWIPYLSGRKREHSKQSDSSKQKKSKSKNSDSSKKSSKDNEGKISQSRIRETVRQVI
jgi:hypothetical protein